MGSIPITRSISPSIASGKAPLIRFEAVTVRADDGRSILDDITVAWDQPRVGVIGANGSGKSTFVRLLNGLVRPAAGAVHVDGLRVDRNLASVRQRVGFVFQQPDHQIVMPTVAEDVAFGLTNQGLPTVQIESRVREVLARYGLSHLAARACYRLSGGEKQLLALAGVAAMLPSLIVFDEPTALLDLRNRNRVRAAIAELSQHVVLVTHDLELLEDFDRVLVFDGGRLIFDGVPASATLAYRESIAD
ncbi:MAG: ABC transporter ATP-binding protein [Pseudomonadota bacterium]